MTNQKQLLAGLVTGIESTPEVCGGNPRIAGTRISVWCLEQYRRLGLTDAQILAAFPSLRAADLVNAWVYVADHSVEIERKSMRMRSFRSCARIT